MNKGQQSMDQSQSRKAADALLRAVRDHLIEQHAERMTLLECLETGKPIAQARGDARPVTLTAPATAEHVLHALNR